MKLLHEMKISELYELFGDWEYNSLQKHILKDWAIAIVKENAEEGEKIGAKKINSMRLLEISFIKDFLIDRFGITEEDLKGD